LEYDEISQRSGIPPEGRHAAVWSAVGSGTVWSRQSFQSAAGTIASRPASAASTPGSVVTGNVAPGAAVLASVSSPAVR
jgi:hypothetical protein